MTKAVPQFDIAIVGAGINGAGIARDAALRGLRVVIFEKNDLCSATTWISSRLIHGGLRYLEYGEIPLVYESLHERRILRVIAPHLVEPLRISIPIYRSARRGPLLIRLGMILYDLLSWGKLLPGHDMLNRDELIDAEPGLNTVGLRGAACYYDAQIAFAERLVLENLLAAKAAGADIRTYSQVVGIEAGTRNRIRFEDALTGETGMLDADVLVNAAGPWVDDVLSTAGKGKTDFIGGTKGSHIIVGKFEGAPSNAFYVEAAADGRPIFIVPWNGQYLIGTTDIRYDGDLDAIRASREEIDYLIEETNRVFPAANLSTDDVHYTYSGVRPLPMREEGPESAITRRHIIKANKDIGPGVLSIIGGKLTTYRNLARQTVDRVGKMLHRKIPECRTHDTLLPGAYGVEEARVALQEHGVLSERGIDRMIAIYGGRARRIVELARLSPGLAEVLDEERTTLAAEVALAAREEFARTLADIVFRRMMIGLRTNQGRDLYESVSRVAASELDWDETRRQAELRDLAAYSDSLRA
jgi:glycerol-3-phosphate dehydrogenase